MISTPKIITKTFRASLLNRALSSGVVCVKEQKVQVGQHKINYVESSIDGNEQHKVLVCLPGALGEFCVIEYKI